MTAEEQTNRNSDTASKPASEAVGASDNGGPPQARERRSAAKKGVAKAAAGPKQAASKAKEVAGAAGQVTSTAVTAWGVVKHRKAIASGTAVALGGMLGGAFLLGRRSAARGGAWASCRKTAHDLLNRK